MMEKQTLWRWKEGMVDERQEHMELRYGDAEHSSYESWIPIARVSKPKRYIFTVEWVVGQDSLSDQTLLGEAKRQLDFYLVEQDITAMPDHWAYAIYHCNSMGNMYSRVHWSYFPTGNQGVQEASKVINLSEDESKRLFGTSKKSGKYIKGG